MDAQTVRDAELAERRARRERDRRGDYVWASPTSRNAKLFEYAQRAYADAIIATEQAERARQKANDDAMLDYDPNASKE